MPFGRLSFHPDALFLWVWHCELCGLVAWFTGRLAGCLLCLLSIWVWVNIKTPDRRVLSMCPFTRASHFGHLFLTHGHLLFISARPRRADGQRGLRLPVAHPLERGRGRCGPRQRPGVGGPLRSVDLPGSRAHGTRAQVRGGRLSFWVFGGWLGTVRGKKGSCFSQHSGIQKCLTFRLLVLCRVELPGLHEVRHTVSTLLLCYFWTV